MQATPFKRRMIIAGLLWAGALLVALAYGVLAWEQAGLAERVLMVGACLAMLTSYWLLLQVVRRCAQGYRQLVDSARLVSKGEGPASHSVSVREFVPLADLLASWEQKRTRHLQRLDETKTRLETLLGSMQEGVIAVDSKSRVLFANDASHRLLECVDTGIRGKSLLEVSRTKALHDLLAVAFETKEEVTAEFDLLGHTRKTLAFRATILPGENSAVLVVLHDITELRRLESMRQDLAANVGHELKTPLASIKAYAETLRNGAIDDPQFNLKFLTRIEEQADRLHELIQDLMQIARIESDEAAFEILPLDVREILESAIQAHEAEADAKEITISKAMMDEVAMVDADSEGLMTIVGNLIINAIKYTPHGGRVTVRLLVEDDQAVIEVEDTGIGISPKHHSRIFERFYRVDTARSRELGGTGLGLAIVKHLAQAFGGGVSLQSDLGAGSCFRVHLPLSMASRPLPISSPR